MNGPEMPVATYRVQLNATFRFADVQELVPYLSRLGVTHLYSSPVLRSRSGSEHGYDVVDPKAVNSELGDETEFRAMVSVLHAFGMGVILDIVPNHLAASSTENRYWREVLTYGRSAPHAHWFDIDWRLADPEMWGRVLVPVLGAPLPQVLAENQLCVAWREGHLVVRYFDHLLPLDPGTTPIVFRAGLDELVREFSAEHPTVVELITILKKLEEFPRRATWRRMHGKLPVGEVEMWLSQLARLVASSPRTEQWAAETAAQFGAGDEGRSRLRELLKSQNYRLVYWRRAATAINYRRFFDINSLISVRQEDPQVFAETHDLIGRWLQDELLDGVRVDHLDGLRDPQEYVERLRSLVGQIESKRCPPIIWVEKILARGERLRNSWPVDGTTGYNFLNEVESALVAPAGFTELEAGYRRLLRRHVRFSNCVERGKRRELRQELSAYVRRLADMLDRLARQIAHETSGSEETSAVQDGGAERDANQVVTVRERMATVPLPAYELSRLTKRELVDAIVEVAVALPVYRTYVDRRMELHAEDRRYLENSLVRARDSMRATPEAIAFLEDVLLLRRRDQWPDHLNEQSLAFIQRFQQLTGPAAAKGVEDTALYVYVPLVSLNEVGGEPDRPLLNAVCALHQAAQERQRDFPRDMLCVTTHDTKRSADTRARLDVLSEVPRLWNGYVSRWRRQNRPFRIRLRNHSAPDAVAEYLFYQSIVGIWPAADPRHEAAAFPDHDTLEDLRDRLERYMLKAVREAKIRTSWGDGDRQYEEAVVSFVASCFAPRDNGSSAFLRDVHALVTRIARPGFWNSLSRTLIQFTAPGTPDLYQGDELWNLALVDPDNRRPVDYRLRKCLLDEIVQVAESPESAVHDFIRQLVNTPEDGRVKLFLIHALLRARREHAELFTDASYQPLRLRGPLQEHVIAFARVRGPRAVVALAARLPVALGNGTVNAPIGPEVWRDGNVLCFPSSLREFSWQSALTRERLWPHLDGQEASLALSRIFSALPVALLVGNGLAGRVGFEERVTDRCGNSCL